MSALGSVTRGHNIRCMESGDLHTGIAGMQVTSTANRLYQLVAVCTGSVGQWMPCARP